MEIKVENNDLFIKFDGEDHWSNIGSCAWTTMPTNYIKFEPTPLKEEPTVEEVKLQGVNIELSAIL